MSAPEGASLGIDAWLVEVPVDAKGLLAPELELEALFSAAGAGGPPVGLQLRLEQPLSPSAEASLAVQLAGWMARPGALRRGGRPVLLLLSSVGFSHVDFGPRRLLLGLHRELRRLGVRQEPWLVGPHASPLWDATLLWPHAALADYQRSLQHVHHGPWPSWCCPWLPVVLPPPAGSEAACAGLYREWLEQAGALAALQAGDREQAVVVLPDWQAHRQWLPARAPLRHRLQQGLAPAPIAAAGVNNRLEAWGEPKADHLAVLVHGFYPDRFTDLLARLRGGDPDGASDGLDLYVSTPLEQLGTVAGLLHAQRWPRVRLHGVPNRGRDLAPFLLQLLPDALRTGHRLFVKVHTKRSGHLSDGEIWAEHLLGSLLEPTARQGWQALLEADPHLGLIAPAGTLLACSVALHTNVDHLLALCARRAVSPATLLQRRFIAGTMMAGRLNAIAHLPELGLQLSDFEEEQGQTDGTLAHALERWLCCEAALRGWRLEELPGEARAVPGFGHGRPDIPGISTTPNVPMWSALPPPDAF